MELKIYWAEVININDTTQKSRIQIRLQPEFKDVDSALLPWARPFFGNGKAETMNKKVPIIGTLIWVLSDPYFREIYYLGDYTIEGFFTFSTITDKLSQASEISNIEYKNINFELLADGSLRFNNLSTGDLGIIHKSGGYSIFDNLGNIYIKPNSKKVFIENGTNNLHDIIEEMRAIVERIITPLKLTSPSGPVTYLDVSTDLPTIIANKSKLDNLLGA